MNSFALCLPCIFLPLASCGVNHAKSELSSECYNHFDRLQTHAQGVADTKRHIRDKGYRILRYDLPGIRTGGWEEHDQPFRHFGIEEANEFFASLDYCRAYNSEMDRQLTKRYGDEYRQLRSKIMPKFGAGRYQY